MMNPQLSTTATERLTATETLTEAIEFDRLAESYRMQGYCDIRAADLAYMQLYPYIPPRPHGGNCCPAGTTAHFLQLLKSMFDASDFALHRDYGTWYAEATTAEAKTLGQYVRLRRKTPRWHPGSVRSTLANPNPQQPNNHSQVDPSKMARILNRRPVKTRQCKHCQRDFQAVTKRREYCSDRCRLRAHRSPHRETKRCQKRAPVDDSSPLSQNELL